MCLNAKEMKDHVDHIEPLKAAETRLHLWGTVVLEVRFGPDGKLACVHVKSGHPMAISAAVEAIKRSTFKPAISHGVAKAGCGLITIKYRLQDVGSSTELQ
jgi:outer membrane biosynthesis protein TonB